MKINHMLDIFVFHKLCLDMIRFCLNLTVLFKRTNYFMLLEMPIASCLGDSSTAEQATLTSNSTHQVITLELDTWPEHSLSRFISDQAGVIVSGVN